MSLSGIKHIGPARLAALSELGIESVEDLLYFFPSSYADPGQPVSARDCAHGKAALISGRVKSAPVRLRARSGRGYILCECESDGGDFSAVFFNSAYVMSALEKGEKYLFYGKVSKKGKKVSLANPIFERENAAVRLRGIMPSYPLKGLIPQGTFARIIRSALSSAHIRSVVPEILARQFTLAPLRSALEALHSPESLSGLAEAAERAELERFLVRAVGCRISGMDAASSRETVYGGLGKALERYEKALPYDLTSGQKSVIKDIISDLSGSRLMNRLLQGDVGSGKTAVALFAMYAAAESGFQAAMIAPTELLARQHFDVASKLLSPLGVECALITASASGRKSAENAVSEGNARAVFGTHALLSDSVKFNDLRLIVTDEQHRFGVRQRAALMSKSASCDVLAMSATPIPRTLSMLFYGGLSLSEIREKPEGRAGVTTRVVEKRRAADMFRFAAQQAAQGVRVYVVCPAIGKGEDAPDDSAEKLHKKLVSGAFRDIPSGLLHGGMRESEKYAALEAFRRGNTVALVSTTVVEVGVDVPEAGIMCVMSAERFGLSQLHQLRGRVGRGSGQGRCFLVADAPSEKARERLKVLVNCEDGFEIAEADLAARGAGDFLGTHQSGASEFSLSAKSLSQALRIASEIPLTDGYLRFYRSLTGELSAELGSIAMN